MHPKPSHSMGHLRCALWLTALALSVACSTSTTAVPCKAPQSVKELQLCENCRANIDVARADFEHCAAGAAESCQRLTQDLQHLEKLNPHANQAPAAQANTHLGPCQTEGPGGASCQALRGALAQLSCN